MTRRRSRRLVGGRRVWTPGTVIALVASSCAIAVATPIVQELTAHAATSCPAGGCQLTVEGHDFSSGDPLPAYNFLVNLDNSKLPSDPKSLSTESNSPIVAEGNEGHNVFRLPAGRYLISMRAADHKMLGKH